MEVIADCQGINSHIPRHRIVHLSPSWYLSKQEHGEVVPTWNYIVFHVHGIPHAITDRDWLYKQLNSLTNQFESGRQQPWKVSDAPSDFTDRMVKGIVGIEIPLNNIQGMWKSSQNKQKKVKEGGISGLGSDEMASYVSEHTA